MFEYKKTFHFILGILIVFILFKLTSNIDVVWSSFKKIISLSSPFLWAFSIAYILNPVMQYLEKKFKMKRIYSIGVLYIFVLEIIILSIIIISPKLANSIGQIIEDMPRAIDNTQKWIDNNIIKWKYFQKYGTLPYFETKIKYIIGRGSDFLDILLNNIINSVIYITSTFVNFLLGLVISIYLLKDKEGFIRGIKKILYAFLQDNQVKEWEEFGKEVDNIFSAFIIGKLIDSFIIGFFCFLGMIAMKAPYALLLSIIIGITNMIPYFGPIIGMIPAVLITLFYNPIKAVWVFLFLFILQQFDGWYLGPKILGDKIGLSAFWVIVGIVMGGGFFGVLGMFLGVPIIAILKMMIERYINKRIISKR